MNIIITLPKNLLDKIISGEKIFEMRKTFPRGMRIREDGFFVVEKGTDKVRCWCRVDNIIKMVMTKKLAISFSKFLGVSPQYVINYAPFGTKVFMWSIGKVKIFQDLCRYQLLVDSNPQSFAYCPLSYGESF